MFFVKIATLAASRLSIFYQLVFKLSQKSGQNRDMSGQIRTDDNPTPTVLLIAEPSLRSGDLGSDLPSYLIWVLLIRFSTSNSLHQQEGRNPRWFMIMADIRRVMIWSFEKYI